MTSFASYCFSPPVTSSPIALISEKLAPLTPQQRAAFDNLSYVNYNLNPDEHPGGVALAKFETNAVAAGKDHVGIFPNMARLNHGCSSAFNVVYSWREQEQALVVYALKEVKKGQVSKTVTWMLLFCPGLCFLIRPLPRNF